MTDIYLGKKRHSVAGSREFYPIVALNFFDHRGGRRYFDALTPTQARALGQLLLDEAAIAAGDDDD